jgi:Zn-dependent protease/CBS domain-containing protein
MGGSIYLFSIRGIGIRMHITFPLILIWGAVQFGMLSNRGMEGAIFGIVVTLLLFAVVVLHELGHSFAAQYYGVEVKRIVLLPIGGVAQLGSIPENPVQEFVIAIAGPLVNFVLAGIFFVAGLAIGQDVSLSFSTIIESMGQLTPASIFNYVFFSNLFLGVFNLLPAFPMDGGRVLRALLATQMNYARATVIAASVGQGLAWIFGLWGFLNGGIFMILIAVFIFLGAGQERQLVELRYILAGLTVEQAYSRQAHIIGPQTALREVVDLTLSSFQADFPVCEDRRLIGLLPYTRLIEALNNHSPDTPVSEVMLTDITPVAPDEEMFAVQQRLSQSQLDALPVVDGDHFLGLITSRDIGELYRLASSQPELLRSKVG